MNKTQKKIEEKMIDENFKMSIENKKNGIFIINSNFTDILLEYLFLDIKKAINNKSIDIIKIYINSRGGEISTLFPLIDLIKGTEKPINTIVMGMAYSAGAMLALCGTNGFRFAHKHSYILLHEVATDNGYSKNSQIQENAKYIDEINKRLIELLKRNSKMTNKQIDIYFNSNKDIFINSTKALNYGIIDKIIL